MPRRARPRPDAGLKITHARDGSVIRLYYGQGDRRTSMANGLLVLDKPGGMTSRDAINRAQRWFPRGTKIGHTGTLDPLATGVLVVCLGRATRLAEYVQAMSKVYR